MVNRLFGKWGGISMINWQKQQLFPSAASIFPSGPAIIPSRKAIIPSDPVIIPSRPIPNLNNTPQGIIYKK